MKLNVILKDRIELHVRCLETLMSTDRCGGRTRSFLSKSMMQHFDFDDKQRYGTVSAYDVASLLNPFVAHNMVEMIGAQQYLDWDAQGHPSGALSKPIAYTVCLSLDAVEHIVDKVRASSCEQNLISQSIHTYIEQSNSSEYKRCYPDYEEGIVRALKHRQHWLHGTQGE